MNEPSGTSTIFAVSSGRGRAGVAVIRVSGPGAASALQALAGGVPPQRQAALRRLRDPETRETLDEALVLFFQRPASFTGEDVAEFHVHGGPAVLQGVMAALGRLGELRPAEAGEFARRAFAKGKLDLTEAEGLADLINAETEAQRRQALRQSAGGLREIYDGWREELIHALALMEAALDFSDEADVPKTVEAQTRPLVDSLAGKLRGHLDDSRRGERLREGLQVVLAGPPNAGKSSLMNALALRDVAIVSHEPGTTRDVLEAHLDLGGYPVTVLDTAGLREVTGEVEQEGMRRALARANDADLAVWLVDATDPRWTPPGDFRNTPERLITVLNKTDLARPDPTDGVEAIALSAKTGEGLERLTAALGARARTFMDAGESPVITRARQRGELERCHQALEQFLKGNMADLELRAEDLRVAARALGRITGRVDVEDVLDRIFGDFCIGK